MQYNKGKTLEQIYSNRKAKEIRAKLRQFHLGQICSFKIKRELRVCKCGCRKKFKCKINSKQKFIQGHNSKLKSAFKGRHHTPYSKKLLSESHKGQPAWNKGLTKETDKRVALYSKKGSITAKNQFVSGERISYFKNAPSKYGKKAYHWKGGPSLASIGIRRLQQYWDWRTKIFERDNFTCQICDKEGGYLEVHHIKPFSTIFHEFRNKYRKFRKYTKLLELAIHYKPFWNVKNGITLCLNCHNKNKKRKVG